MVGGLKTMITETKTKSKLDYYMEVGGKTSKGFDKVWEKEIDDNVKSYVLEKIFNINEGLVPKTKPVIVSNVKIYKPSDSDFATMKITFINNKTIYLNALSPSYFFDPINQHTERKMTGKRWQVNRMYFSTDLGVKELAQIREEVILLIVDNI